MFCSETEHLKILSRPLWDKISSDFHRLKVCMLSTFVFGLWAHGYGFLNFTINHDSLNEFYWESSMRLNIGVGRFIAPIIKLIVGQVTVSPWMNGIIFLLMSSFSIFMISKMFLFDSVWENVILCGLFTTSPAMTALFATYIHDAPAHGFAIFMVCSFFYYWLHIRSKFSIEYEILGTLCLIASLGCYEAYLQTALALMVIYSIIELLKGEHFRSVFLGLLRGVPMILASVIGFFLIAFSVSAISNISLSGTEGNDITKIGDNLLVLGETFSHTIQILVGTFFVPNSSSTQSVTFIGSCNISLIHILLFSSCLIYLIELNRIVRYGKAELSLLILLFLFLPISMTCIMLVSGSTHTLLSYSLVLFYPLTLLIAKQHQAVYPEKKKLLKPMVIFILLLTITISNIQVANAAYMKKETERQGTLSRMTRVVDMLEDYEGYIYEYSEVLIGGTLFLSRTEHPVSSLSNTVGLSYKSTITYSETVEQYFDIVLQYPIRYCSKDKEEQILESEEYKNLGIFPAKDCIATIDNVIVIKMGEAPSSSK